MSRTKEVVVVGHGPSPTGQGWGPRIDRADVVIRLWDCEWQTPADYGSRYDIGSYPLRGRDLKWFARSVRRTPREWWAYDPKGRGLIGLPTPRRITTRFHPAEAVRVGRDLGGSGTSGALVLMRGTAVASHAILTLRPEVLVLVGFDDVRLGAISPVPYPAAMIAALPARGDDEFLAERLAVHTPGVVRTHGHDRSVEAGILTALAARVGTCLKWAAPGEWPEPEEA